MLHSLLVAVLLSLELVSQTPGKTSVKTANWVVIQSRDDGFSFSMPTRPAESVKASETPFGRVVFKTYRCSLRDHEFLVQHSTLSQPIPLNKVVTLLHAAKNASVPRLPRVVEEKPIALKDVAGLELLCQGPVANHPGNRTVKVHLFVQGNSQYILIALSAPEQPLPPETNLFLDSFRLGGALAVIPGVATKPKPAPLGKRMPLAKVDRVDDTPEDAPAHLHDGGDDGGRADSSLGHAPGPRDRLPPDREDSSRYRAPGIEYANAQDADPASEGWRSSEAAGQQGFRGPRGRDRTGPRSPAVGRLAIADSPPPHERSLESGRRADDRVAQGRRSGTSEGWHQIGRSTTVRKAEDPVAIFRVSASSH